MTPTDLPLLRQVLLDLRAGRWHEAHQAVQTSDSLRAAWLHGIVHYQEGDLEDAEYWYGRAGRNFRQRGTLDEELAAFDRALHAPDRPASPESPESPTD